MKNIIIYSIIFLFSLSSCTSSKDFEKGARQLESMGYTDIENTGYDAFCCSDDDSFSTGFSCKNKAGETVKGCFCSGALKGITIRFQ
jgi:hypothetical protein